MLWIIDSCAYPKFLDCLVGTVFVNSSLKPLWGKAAGLSFPVPGELNMGEENHAANRQSSYHNTEAPYVLPNE